MFEVSPARPAAGPGFQLSPSVRDRGGALAGAGGRCRPLGPLRAGPPRPALTWGCGAPGAWPPPARRGRGRRVAPSRRPRSSWFPRRVTWQPARGRRAAGAAPARRAGCGQWAGWGMAGQPARPLGAGETRGPRPRGVWGANRRSRAPAARWKGTPVLLLKNSMDSPWGCKEPDTTVRLTHTRSLVLLLYPTMSAGANTDSQE